MALPADGGGHPTFAILTLGCRVNQCESVTIARELAAGGCVEVSFEESADFYIVNTCTVTALADKKSRQMVRRALRLNDSARVFAVGCSAQAQAASLSRLSPRVTLVGNEDKPLLPAMLRALCEREPCTSSSLPPQGRARALLKVQDGCNHRCTYCIVPSVRGEQRSTPMDDALRQARELEREGFAEIVVTGIHLGAWGSDLSPRASLPALVERLLEGTERARFRLSSLEPHDFSDSLLALMEASPRLCPHLHLPLQHGSDRILKRMNRGYTPARYREIVEAFHHIFPLGGLSTDVMVGFPGEEDDDVEALRRFIEELPFTRLHVFKYSPRPGTAAAQFPRQVPQALKDARSSAIIRLGREKSADFVRRNAGRVVRVLMEERGGDGSWEGTAENYLEVVTESAGDIQGKVLPVQVTGSRHGKAVGAVVPGQYGGRCRP